MNSIPCILLLCILLLTIAEVFSCANYTVELRATYPDGAVIPCSDDQSHVIQRLIHALIASDSIISLGVTNDIPNFALDRETYGPNVQTILEPSAADNLPTSQSDLSKDHLITEDILEDMYYQVNNDLSSSENQKNLGQGDQEKQDERPPPPLEPMDGSLRGATKSMGGTSKSAADDGHERRYLEDLTDFCNADLCSWYVSEQSEESCSNKSDSSLSEEEEWIKRQSFNQRLEKVIAKKLRKWARDNNIHCLGNSWQLETRATTRMHT